MIAARRLAIVCAISCVLAAPACGRYGPPVRTIPSGTAAEDSGLLDNARDETMPFVLDGLTEDLETAVEPADSPADRPADRRKGEPAEEAPAGEGNPAP